MHLYQYDPVIEEPGTLHEELTMLGHLYTADKKRLLLQKMITGINWQTDFIAFGRRFDMPRRQAWFADEGVHYRYSSNMLQGYDWAEPLISIRKDVEALTGHFFNSVLVTYYRDGNDHVTWHADDEEELGDCPVIASLSLGATREFQYRHRLTGEVRSMKLHDGELLLMQAGFQQNWEHCVPPGAGIAEPRVNLTFRSVVMVRD